MNKNNSLVIFKSGGKLLPTRAISLLDIMREFIASNIYQWNSLLEQLMEESCGQLYAGRFFWKDILVAAC